MVRAMRSYEDKVDSASWKFQKDLAYMDPDSVPMLLWESIYI